MLFMVWAMSVIYSAHGLHKAQFELQQLDWNKVKKTYQAPRKISLEFDQQTGEIWLDTLGSDSIFIKFSVMPVYHDKGFEYGFLMELYSKGKNAGRLETKSRYKPGTYEAGATGTSMQGVKKWTGSLRYFPDTAIKYKAASWRSDHYTLRISNIQTWRPKNEKSLKLVGYSVEGNTGGFSRTQKLGKIGDEKITLICEGVRFQWGKEVWTELILHWYAEKDGKTQEFLSHTIKSTDKNVLAVNREIQNKYQINGTQGSKALLTYVKMIPY
jgi:hypothetical protein